MELLKEKTETVASPFSFPALGNGRLSRTAYGSSERMVKRRADARTTSLLLTPLAVASNPPTGFDSLTLPCHKGSLSLPCHKGSLYADVAHVTRKIASL